MEKIITTEVAADALGISVRRVRQLIKDLRIEPQMIGKAIILSPADLKKMQTRKTQRGPAKKGK